LNLIGDNAQLAFFTQLNPAFYQGLRALGDVLGGDLAQLPKRYNWEVGCTLFAITDY